jgi:hypothetical protein
MVVKSGAVVWGALPLSLLLGAWAARAETPPTTDPGAGSAAPAAGSAPAPDQSSPSSRPSGGATPGTAASPGPGVSGSPAATPVSGSPSAGGSYTVRLRDLEHRVNELKEQIFRSKARLNLLKETVLHGVIAGARSTITHRNEMGGMYQPIRYVYALDGAEIFAKTDESGKLGDQKEIEIFNGSIVPGNHTLSVQMVYQGNGYGVFSYLKGYKFTAKSSHTFTASEGKQLQLKVVGYEKGNPVTTDPKDRPAVDFRETVIADKDAAAKQPAAKK